MGRERGRPDNSPAGPHLLDTLLENNGRPISDAVDGWKRQVSRSLFQTPPLSQFSIACSTPALNTFLPSLVTELGRNPEHIHYIDFDTATFRPIDKVVEELKKTDNASQPVFILRGFTKSFDHATGAGGHLSQPVGHIWGQSIRDGLAKAEFTKLLEEKGGLTVIIHIEPHGSPELYKKAARDALSSQMKDGMIWLGE